MVVLENIILAKILYDPKSCAEYFTKLESRYFESTKPLYVKLSKIYQETNKLPNRETFELTLRDSHLKSLLKSLETDEELLANADLDILVPALVDEFLQNEALVQLRKFVETITLKSAEEIKESLTEIVMHLDKQSPHDSKAYDMSNLFLFHETEDAEQFIPLGISNDFDANLSGGMRPQELLLFGGQRGSGKSLIAANIVCNQYELGYSAAYFTIEMTANETFERMLAIMSGVPYKAIRSKNLADSDKLKVLTTKADMFVGAEEALAEYVKDRDAVKFEKALARLPLKEGNQIHIIDDRELTIASIDLQLQKLKAKLGDKLRVVVIDYVNQVLSKSSAGSEMYDWKQQIEVSKQLKNLARKYNVLMISPYQTDGTNAVRYAKGLLDAADASFVMDKKSDEGVGFTVNKMRAASDSLTFTCGVTWDILKLDPSKPVTFKEKDESEEKPTKKSAKSTPTGEEANDLPF